MTEKTKQLLMQHGLSKQQVESKALDVFVRIAAEEQGLLDREIMALNASLREKNSRLQGEVYEAESIIRRSAQARRSIDELKAEIEKLQAEIEALRETKLNESIDDAKTRNFMALIEWLDKNYNEQQIKSFCNIGKGFFGGWIDPPAEIVNNKPTRRRA